MVCITKHLIRPNICITNWCFSIGLVDMRSIKGWLLSHPKELFRFVRWCRTSMKLWVYFRRLSGAFMFSTNVDVRAPFLRWFFFFFEKKFFFVLFGYVLFCFFKFYLRIFPCNHLQGLTWIDTFWLMFFNWNTRVRQVTPCFLAPFSSAISFTVAFVEREAMAANSFEIRRGEDLKNLQVFFSPWKRSTSDEGWSHQHQWREVQKGRNPEKHSRARSGTWRLEGLARPFKSSSRWPCGQKNGTMRSSRGHAATIVLEGHGGCEFPCPAAMQPVKKFCANKLT